MKVFAIFIVAVFAIQAISADVSDEIPELEDIDTLEDGTVGALFCWRKFAKQTKHFISDAKSLVKKFEKCSGKNILPKGEEEDGMISQMLCWRGFTKQAKALIEDGKELISKFEDCKSRSGDETEDASESESETDGTIGNIICWRRVAKQTKALINSVRDLVSQFEKCIGKGKSFIEIESEEEVDGTISTILCWRKFTKKLKALISDARDLYGNVKGCAGKTRENETLEEDDQALKPALDLEPDVECWIQFVEMAFVNGCKISPLSKDLFDSGLPLYKEYLYCSSLPNETALQQAKRKACFTKLKAKGAIELIKWRKILVKIAFGGKEMAAKLEQCQSLMNPDPEPEPEQ